MLSRIKSRASEIHAETVERRRFIHSYPELSFHEEKTSAFVAKTLNSFGLKAQEGVGGYGVVALIEGKKAPSDKVVALRADMDALPILEANEVPYCSQNEGVMHACGHDAHTSSLLGTARILSELTDEFAGTIKLIFQPAEERVPGGASIMIKDGVLQNPQVNSIIGQHVQPYLDCGKIGIRSGMYMASADEIYLTIKGKGGHAAHPATFVDPITASAQVLVALQQVVSRSDPRIPSVLSFGKLRAEGATNIIPDEVEIIGTFRTMDEVWRAEAHARIERTIVNVAAAFGCTADLEIRKGYPFLVNDEALTARTTSALKDYMGEENVVDLDLWMAAEDFAWYTHQVPGCFYRLGTRNEARGITHGLHTPRFDIDEDSLRISTGLMAYSALVELG
ncbi:MAG: M20 family metallopeptidase [Bacteroidia bacterium]